MSNLLNLAIDAIMVGAASKNGVVAYVMTNSDASLSLAIQAAEEAYRQIYSGHGHE